MQYSEWLEQAVIKLSASDSAKRDAEILLEYSTGRSRTFIFAFGETELALHEQQQLTLLLQRRVNGEPIAYIVGEREFWSLPLYVSPATLIPRPDTECLVERALMCLPTHQCDILDLGTGTGAIALALASEKPECTVIGVDFNLEAVALAQRNQQRLNISNVQFLQSNWFASLILKQFDMIVSNPPYIDENDNHLREGDVRFEPATALVAKNRGLADLTHIITESTKHLKKQGWLLLEHGWQQGQAVRNLLEEHGYANVETYLDYGGRDRVSLGQWDV